tara:strand:- start:230 stop:418 length:189 start_codon:yes stop_codon:yes gene_type:complete
MKIGDMVMLSKKAQKQSQNRHIAWDSIGFVCREMDADRLFYVKWFRHISETMHYRYELRIAK